MTLVILVILLLPLGIGLSLIVIGVRGARVGDHPVCGHCGFDLFGQPVGTVICGECGSSLNLPQSVLIGHHQKRSRLLLAGLIILVPVLFVGGVMLRGQISGTNWLSDMPNRVVTWMAESSSPASRTTALAELHARLTAGTLQTDDLAPIADAGLAYQADLSKPWDSGWGDLLEAIQSKGKLSDERWKQYLSQALQGSVAFQVRPRVRRGDSLPYAIASTPRRAGKMGGLWVEVDGLNLEWQTPQGTVPVTGVMGGWGAPLGGGGGASSSNLSFAQFPKNIPDGRQQLNLVGNARVGFSTNGGSRMKAIMTSWLKLPAVFTLVPADQPTVRLVDDPALAAAIRAALRPEFVGNTWTPPWPSFVVTADGPPVGLSFNILSRVNGTELNMGSFACPAGTTSHSWSESFIPAPVLAAQSVDVILRSNIDPASNSIDTFEMWQGEIVFKDVPVK